MLTDEYNTSQICPICNECKIIHPKINIKYNKTVKINDIKTKVEITRETENYRLCYCDSNKNHPHNEGYHKLWFCRDYVGGLNQINRIII